MAEHKPLPQTDKTTKPEDILGTWISLSAGLGMVIGLVWFDQFFWGLVMGAALGMVFGAAFTERAKAKARTKPEDV